MSDGNGFDQYKKLLLHEMEEHTKAIQAITQSINHMDRRLAEFEGKAKVMSILAGVVGGGVMSVIVTVIVTFIK